MPSEQGGRPGGRQRLITAIALAAALAGIGLLVVFFAVQSDPPRARPSGTTAPSTQPNGGGSNSADSDSGGSNSGDTAHKSRDKPQNKAGAKQLGASRPTSISIAAIDVDSPVMPIGKTPDGALAVPKGKDIDKAAWYENSPTPGQTGPSVIEGHIDTVDGPSVFYRLAALQPGDTIKITRADQSRATFTVNAVHAYPSKEAFPTKLVYGGDLSKPSLRLVTCANFDDSTGHYAGNTVVYANLTTIHRGRAHKG